MKKSFKIFAIAALITIIAALIIISVFNPKSEVGKPVTQDTVKYEVPVDTTITDTIK